LVHHPAEMKKISVVGAGALGTLVGGLIQHAQPAIETVLFGRGPHLRAMQQRGSAELRGPWGVYQVKVNATEDVGQIAGSDLILFTVKSQDTKAAAALVADVCGEAVIVSLQNGINQRELLRYFSPARLVVGMTTTNMTSLEPGIVEFHRNGVSVLGPAASEVSSETIAFAQRALSSSSLRFTTDLSILGAQYNKLLFNTMGYASVLSASDFIREGLLHRGWRRNVAIPLLDEGMRVLERAGIKLHKVPGGSDVLRLRKVMGMLNLPGLDFFSKMAIGLFNPPRIVFSVYQDLHRQRPTEIDYVNGEIVRLATDCGIDAPFNREVVRAIRELEAGGGKRFFAAHEVIERFANLAGGPR